jgi:tetratricopeptide (TPR) repeat protein
VSILIGPETRLLVQGITGREGEFHARAMQAYGTNIVAGVTPGKGGQTALDGAVPVFDTVADAVRETGAARFKALQSDMRARYVMETRSFAELATARDFGTSGELFVIGVSAVRMGTPNAPDMVLAELKRRAGAPGSGSRQLDVAVMEKEMAAVMAVASGRPADAIARMQEAIALERELPPPMGPPRPLKPASELFGEILLEMGQPREAAAELDRALARWPNRSAALLGRARAAAALGDRDTARSYYKRLLANWKTADPALPELKEARGF